LQRDIVVDHRAEPADRVDGLGREFRVVAVKGNVDLDRRACAARSPLPLVRDTAVTAPSVSGHGLIGTLVPGAR